MISLTTKLAILQQSEYQWNHYRAWLKRNSDNHSVIEPKKWTLKLRLLHFISIIFSPLLGTDVALYSGLVFLTFPQKIFTVFFLYMTRWRLRYLQSKGLQVIAIAGSYGKTSTKTILSHVLSEKFKTIATPGNINRPLGFARLILQQLTKDHQFFIAEMGEYTTGDIRFMTEFLSPTFVILTPKSVAHYERFGSVALIEDELTEALQFSKSGAIVHTSYEEALKRRKLTNTLKWYGESQVTGVSLSRSGTEFKVKLQDQELNCFIPLFGKHNAVNTLPSILLAKDLGMPDRTILGRLSSLPLIQYRLEPTLLENNILLLNNGYNSNPDSAKETLSVLREIDGSQKIVCTPGFVELGEIQEKENEKLGELVAKVADYCVVIKGINTDALLSGLAKGKFDKNKVIVAKDEQEGMQKLSSLLKPSAVILFENSVPALYQ